MNDEFEKIMYDHHREYNPEDYEYKLAYSVYSAGVAAERERTQPYIDQLEQAWLQLTRGNLIDGGMKVEQARIHAQAMLDDAKHKILAAAIRKEDV